MLCGLVHVSRPAILPHSPEVLDIVQACLRNNSPRGLTKFLYFDRFFLA
jgi:hypothetical protein